MTQDRLESPPSTDSIYLASSVEEVEEARPILTGDVFEELDIPGVDQVGYGMIVTHPCSMRADGVRLSDKLLIARVAHSTVIPFSRWETGHFKVMPLPDLMGQHHSVLLDEIGRVSSSALYNRKRVACLSPFGINLLQQRFIWHLTRFLVPTYLLGKAAEGVFEEVDLCEEWVSFVRRAGGDVSSAPVEFHGWIRSEDDSGVMRQERLSEPQQRAVIRKQMRNYLAKEYG